MIDKRVLKEVLDLALVNGGDFADIFIERKVVTGIGVEGSKIERVHSGIDIGAGIRVLAGDSTAYAYTNDLSKDGLTEAARIVSKATRGSKKEYDLDLRKIKPVVDFTFFERPDEVSTQNKVAAVEAADQSARAVDKSLIRQVMVSYADVVQQVIIANSFGGYVEDERIRTRLAVNAVAAEGDIIQTGYEAIGGLSGFELLKQFTPEETGKIAGSRAVQMLHAQPAPA
ncbi:MAG: DNA gyrase modulator, partial [Spirochaetota bacterium]